ncbi:MAG: hypothetical protein SYNGOMJ08_00695 [Candidatus Syntrophoarchaeum sp. GoM_oil]|nr:MAG: hypothetical protein SYNGOMJ08_00695 [Candidatus Syntrophoarchaeum sp. GoM_oil]
METEAENSHKEYIEGIVKTAVPLVFGALGGIISYLLDPSNPTNDFGWLVLVAAVLAQALIYPQFSIDVKEFKFKDWFYASFMTFIAWFVTWGLVLMAFTPTP